MSAQLPVFPAEDHQCDACEFAYADVSHDDGVSRLRSVSGEFHGLVANCSKERLSAKRQPDEWSIVEYLCHVRDVFMTSTIRLHRTRTEENPRLDPMLNDLRARRFRYNEWSASAVLAEIDATAAGFIDEAARLQPTQFTRVATGPMGDQRTALWFVRHALHETLHHRDDIRRLTDLASAT